MKKKTAQAEWSGRRVSEVIEAVRVKGKVYRRETRPSLWLGDSGTDTETAELEMLRFSLGVTRRDVMNLLNS